MILSDNSSLSLHALSALHAATNFNLNLGLHAAGDLGSPNGTMSRQTSSPKATDFSIAAIMARSTSPSTGKRHNSHSIIQL